MIRVLLFVLMLLPGALWAQSQPPQPAVLVADDVSVTADRVLVARGNVQVFQGDVTLNATSVTYDQRSDTLQIEGPIRLQDGDGYVVSAQQAELDNDLRNGILRSARLVLNQQLQLAAVQINRVDGRYSQLYKTAVTSCRVCNDGRPPLWQIRAKRIVHDQLEQQLYFDQAQLRVRNVPILYLPRLRLPDPSLKRATGFLIPSIRTTSQLATGVKIPYFIRLGQHKDLTLTPYLSVKTRTLEARYRQAFRTGRIEFNGAFSRDTLRSGEDRWYLFGQGAFNLRNDFKLDFDIESTSDDAYLTQYSYSDKDRLDSEIAISRVRRDEYIRAGFIHFNSLRTGELNSTLPTNVVDAVYEKRLFPTALGGEVRLNFGGHTHFRTSNADIDGRDVGRLHASAFWMRGWQMRSGLVVDGRVGLGVDVFNTRQDSSYPDTQSQLIPQAAITLRYPTTKTTPDGATLFLEPVMMLAATGNAQADVANDESARVEFDEGNLLALSRFPVPDRREHGTTLAVGLNWARYDPDGWEAFVSVGQIFRETGINDFSRTSGLRGTTSDFLVAGQIRTIDGLALGGRVAFDEGFDFAKAELRGDWSNNRLTLGGSYLWLVEDPAEDRTKAVSELTLDSAYRIDRHWTLGANWRYDVEDDRTARAGLRLGYENECVAAELSAERRYTSSTSVEPTTKFGFTIALRGFSAQNGTGSYTRSCNTPSAF